jgi:predicted flap endonuclease-1-like 5' DNA nuclease
MLYLIETCWQWFVVAAIAGVAVGYGTTSTKDPLLHGFGGWLRWVCIAFVVGVIVAIFGQLPGRAGFYLETLLGVVFAYVVGSLVGGLSRKAWSHVGAATAPSAVRTSEARAPTIDQAPPVETGAATVHSGVENIKVTEEARRAADAEATEEARRAADAKAVEEARRVADAKAAEHARRVADAKAAEEARRVADAKAAEEARRVADARAAEEARRVADAKPAEEARRAADAEAAEEARPAADAKPAQEDAKAAEETYPAADAKPAQEDAKAAEETRPTADAKPAEAPRRTATAKVAGQTRRPADGKAATQTRRVASGKNGRRVGDAKAAEETRRVVHAKAAEEVRRAADAEAAAEARRAADERARQAVHAKAAEEVRRAADADARRAVEESRRAAEAARQAVHAQAAKEVYRAADAEAAAEARRAADAKAAVGRRPTESKVAKEASRPTARPPAVELIRPDATRGPQVAGSEPSKPIGIDAPFNDKADNLKLIKGIGAKNEKICNDLGVFHFAQIADWSSDEAAWVGHHMAFPGRVEREHWIPQAKLLASGGDTDHSTGVKAGTIALDEGADAPLDEAQTATLRESLPEQALPVENETRHAGRRPYGLRAPRGGQRDNLKRIRGIGPQNESRLNGIGIWHYAQIAAWSAENIKWISGYLAASGRIEREKWVDQAKGLVAGGDTESSRRATTGRNGSAKADHVHGRLNPQVVGPHKEG